MSLHDFTPERVAIKHKGKPLMEVRGSNLEDLAYLVREHLEDLRTLQTRATGAQAEIFSRLNQDGFLLKVLTDLPVIASEIIARAADAEEGGAANIRRLPLGTQILAMQEILRMTLEDVGGPNGLSAILQRMMNDGK